ncbi:hypothetical protein, partial [Sandarakinorhabdus oryzae]|uniref:hypothetical protein n=1 Tax=Sandarakinorhabdus oryzae TaxID=2675220 RepID=UPI0018CBFF39
GRHCLLSGRPLTFVRTSAARPAALTVRRGDGRTLKLAFAAGQQSWTAPAGFFVGGGRYRLTLAGRSQQLTITPLPLPTGADATATLDTIAQGLAAAGCQRQFALMADRIAPARP